MEHNVKRWHFKLNPCWHRSALQLGLSAEWKMHLHSGDSESDLRGGGATTLQRHQTLKTQVWPRFAKYKNSDTATTTCAKSGLNKISYLNETNKNWLSHNLRLTYRIIHGVCCLEIMDRTKKTVQLQQSLPVTVDLSVSDVGVDWQQKQKHRWIKTEA